MPQQRPRGKVRVVSPGGRLYKDPLQRDLQEALLDRRRQLISGKPDKQVTAEDDPVKYYKSYLLQKIATGQTLTSADSSLATAVGLKGYQREKAKEAALISAETVEGTTVLKEKTPGLVTKRKKKPELVAAETDTGTVLLPKEEGLVTKQKPSETEAALKYVDQRVKFEKAIADTNLPFLARTEMAVAGQAGIDAERQKRAKTVIERAGGIENLKLFIEQKALGLKRAGLDPGKVRDMIAFWMLQTYGFTPKELGYNYKIQEPANIPRETE